VAEDWVVGLGVGVMLGVAVTTFGTPVVYATAVLCSAYTVAVASLAGVGVLVTTRGVCVTVATTKFFGNGVGVSPRCA
jgi:hypothetical protein